MANKKLNPILWISSTLGMEGFIGTFVLATITIMYKDFGLDNTQITLYTGMLLLPYSIRPLWGILLDLFKTIKC